MSESTAGNRLTGFDRSSAPARRPESANLADILERVLDKGIVIAGDIQVNLLDIELLTIKLRLVIASVDRAKEMGIDWWEHDPTLSSGHGDGYSELAEENRWLRDRVAALEEADEVALEEPDDPPIERSSRRALDRQRDRTRDRPRKRRPRPPEREDRG